MRRFFSDKRLIVLLVGVILLVALIAVTLKGRGEANVGEQVVKDVVGFGQSIFSKPAHFFTETLADIESLVNTFDENKVLKERLDHYATTEARVAELEVENQRLKELLEKEEDLMRYEPIHATVISRNPDQWEERIIIDRGEKHGVEKNMAVITARGLVGKVVLTTPLTSTVELLSTENQRFRISVQVAGGEVFGLIEGLDKERQQLVMRRIDSNLDIKEGETIISSGLGGIYPKGLLIGKVKEVTTDDYGLTKLAYIEPAANFGLLDHVVVTKRKVTQVEGSDSDNSAFDEEEGAS